MICRALEKILISALITRRHICFYIQCSHLRTESIQWAIDNSRRKFIRYQTDVVSLTWGVFILTHLDETHFGAGDSFWHIFELKSRMVTYGYFLTVFSFLFYP